MKNNNNFNVKTTKNIYIQFYLKKCFIKYIFIILLFLLTLYIKGFYSIFYKLSKNETKYFGIFNQRFDDFNEFNITKEIKNISERELYLKNKTEFYIQRRTRYLLNHHVIYNESNLNTFQDKLNWLIIHESPMYKSSIVDKIKLHDYSKRILGKDICVPILKTYDKAEDINFEELPEKFVLKLNHGSGMNIICTKKSKLNFNKTIKSLNNWKNNNYGLWKSEFQYIYVKRKIFVEQFLSNNPIDYKIFCFNGDPKFIRVRKILKKKRHKKHYDIHNHYNVNWELNDLESGLRGYKRDPKVKIKKPKNLKLMLKYAKMLSQEFVFVRVDFYEVKNRIYLGELTFSPTNSFIRWKNKKQSIYVGNLMNLTKIKYYLFNK